MKANKQISPKKKLELHLVQSSTTDDTLFPIAPVRLTCGKNYITTFAFLDSGSSVSLIDEEIAKQLKAKGPMEHLRLSWTNDVTREDRGSRRIDLEIRGTSELKSYTIKNLCTVKNLNLSSQSLNVLEMVNRFPYLKDVPLTSYKDVLPRVLIGLNNSHISVPLRVKEGCINEPIAIKTPIGWTVSGITTTTSSSVAFATLSIHSTVH